MNTTNCVMKLSLFIDEDGSIDDLDSRIMQNYYKFHDDDHPWE